MAWTQTGSIKGAAGASGASGAKGDPGTPADETRLAALESTTANLVATKVDVSPDVTGRVNIWVGTQAQYSALGNSLGYKPDTIYFVTA